MAGVLRSTPPRLGSRLRLRLALGTAALALAAVLGACSEDLEGGKACATLCPGTDIQSREVTLDAITDDDVVPGLLETGAEQLLPLVYRKDTVETRVVVRFDTLLTQYLDTLTNPDSLKPLDSLADASLLLAVDTTRSSVPDAITLEAYDIDDASEDTTTAGIESRLVPSRLIGTREVARADYRDTIAIPLDASKLLSIIQRTDESRRRLRVAIRVTSPRSVVLRVVPAVRTSTGSVTGTVLRYRQVNTPNLLGVTARSDAPAGDPVVAGRLADFAIAPVQAPRRTDAVFAVGGLPARRTVLRFAIPDSIDQAAAIIQGELRLVQVPDPLRTLVDTVRLDTTASGRRERKDTVVVLPLIGFGAASVTGDPLRASQLARRAVTFELSTFTVPALAVVPSDSGSKSIDVAGILRGWRHQKAGEPRYLVLTAESEGVQAATAYFWSTAASDTSLRPRLYIRYIPRVGYGLP